MERDRRQFGSKSVLKPEDFLTSPVEKGMDDSVCFGTGGLKKTLSSRAGRWGIAALILFFFAVPLLQAQQPEAWALKMFSKAKTDRVHNFGNLALHAEAEHHFVFENIYKEDVEILSAQSNCGCTKVTVPKKVIKSGEKGEIIARVDTSGKVHFGKRKVTITVYFDRPQVAEVQLQIQAFIRSDVVFNPGNVEFGGIAQGKEVSKKVYLEYHGTQPNWTLTQVKKTDPGIKAVAKPVKNSGSGTKMYEVTVSIKENAESGYINDLVRFISNDGDDHSIFIPVHAQILAPLSVKPSYLQLGVVHPGEEVSKNIVIRGSEPFKIEKISSTDPNMKFLTANQTSLVHVIPVTYHADHNLTGSIHQVITVKTSQKQIPDLEIDVTGFISNEPVIPSAGVISRFPFPGMNLPESDGLLALGILNQPIGESQKLAAKAVSSESEGFAKSADTLTIKPGNKSSIKPGMAEVHVKAKQVALAKQVKKPSSGKKIRNNSAETDVLPDLNPNPSETAQAEQPSQRLAQISTKKTPIRRTLPPAEEPEDLDWTEESETAADNIAGDTADTAADNNTAGVSEETSEETSVVAKKPAVQAESVETASSDVSAEESGIPSDEENWTADRSAAANKARELAADGAETIVESAAETAAAPSPKTANEGWVSVEMRVSENTEPSFIPRTPYSTEQPATTPGANEGSSLPLRFRKPAPYPDKTAAGQPKTAATQFSISQPE